MKMRGDEEKQSDGECPAVVQQFHSADTLFPIQKRPHVQLLWEIDEGVQLFLVTRLSGGDKQRI